MRARIPHGEKWQQEDIAWKVAFLFTMLMPIILIVSRAAADVTGGVIIAMFLTYCIAHKHWAWLREPTVVVGFVAWIWLMFVGLFAENPIIAMPQGIPFIRFVLLYAAIRHYVLTRPYALLWLGWAMAAVLAFTVADALWQYMTGFAFDGFPKLDGRLTGPFHQKKVGIYMAKLLFPSLGLLFYHFFKTKQTRAGVAVGALAILTLLAILLSGERGAFLTSALGLFTFLVLFALSEARWRRIILSSLALLVVIIFVLVVSQPWLQERAYLLGVTLESFGESTYGQLFLTGLNIGIENPITGAGLRGFRELCPHYLEMAMTTFCSLHPHNPYIEWFAEAGIVGLAIFIGLVGTLFRTAIKQFRTSSAVEKILPCVAIATLVVNFFPFTVTQSFFSNWPAMMVWYPIGVAFGALNLCGPNYYAQLRALRTEPASV